MAEYSQSYSTQIAATAEDCFRVLTAFENYPDWSAPITKCDVLERDDDGLARTVAFELDITIRTLSYTLAYTYAAPTGADWTLVDGDVADIEGSYRFEPTDTGCTATCTQAIDIGFWIPGFFKSAFEHKALADSVEEFRAAVEART